MNKTKNTKKEAIKDLKKEKQDLLSLNKDAKGILELFSKMEDLEKIKKIKK